MGIMLKGALVSRVLRHTCLAVSLLTLSAGLTLVPIEEVAAQPSLLPLAPQTMAKVRQWAIGGALAIPLLYAGVAYVPSLVKQVMPATEELTGDSYLDTIIRFEDEIVGEEFYYKHNGREGNAKAVEWSPPYNEIMLEATLGDLFSLPVSALKGKRLDLHTYEGADVVYHTANNDLYRGVVMEVYDNQILKILTTAKLKDLHTVSNDENFNASFNFVQFTETLQLHVELY